jgi:hypothetical protein
MTRSKFFLTNNGPGVGDWSPLVLLLGVVDTEAAQNSILGCSHKGAGAIYITRHTLSAVTAVQGEAMTRSNFFFNQ